jgi:deoxyadenosine/deoxycytidine kinase
MFKHNPIISICGLIGVGKTTFTKNLSNELNLPDYYEHVEDNPVLKDFYKDMKKYGFLLQVSNTRLRKNQYLGIQYSNRGGVIDRSIYEDYFFAEALHNANFMNDLEFEECELMFNDAWSSIRQPDLIIYLQTTPERALERIKMRGRLEESGITLEYLEDLQFIYESEMEMLSKKIKVLVINYDEFKPISKYVNLIKEALNTNIMLP